MIRFSLVVLCGLGLALGSQVAGAADPPVDSKAWGKVRTIGPPAPARAAAQRAKLAQLQEIARGLRPIPGVVRGAPDAGPPSLEARGTTRPLGGAELAAAEARIRAKRAAARRAVAERWLGLIGPLPAKPPETCTSVPLTGEALARSLALEREKAAAMPARPLPRERD